MTDPKWDPIEEIRWSARQLTHLTMDAGQMTKEEVVMNAADMGEQILDALEEAGYD